MIYEEKLKLVWDYKSVTSYKFKGQPITDHERLESIPRLLFLRYSNTIVEFLKQVSILSRTCDMLGISQISVKCTFSFDPFLPDFCLFVLLLSTRLRKAKCVGGCGQKRAVPASNCSSSFILRFGFPLSRDI